VDVLYHTFVDIAIEKQLQNIIFLLLFTTRKVALPPFLRPI